MPSVDRRIGSFEGARDGDLVLCESRGVAYQADMTAGRVPYGDDYLAKVRAYEDTPTARAVNRGRVELLQRHLTPGASILDIGAGSGAFVREARAAGFDCMGFDVIPAAVEALGDLYADVSSTFDAVTLWDSIEHMEEPAECLAEVRRDAAVFVSVPIFRDLRRIRDSKHYRPGEHLYYWTREGFIAWMATNGFWLLEESDHEVEAGRDSIGAFAFRRMSRA